MPCQFRASSYPNHLGYRPYIPHRYINHEGSKSVPVINAERREPVNLITELWLLYLSRTDWCDLGPKVIHDLDSNSVEEGDVITTVVPRH